MSVANPPNATRIPRVKAVHITTAPRSSRRIRNPIIGPPTFPSLLARRPRLVAGPRGDAVFSSRFLYEESLSLFARQQDVVARQSRHCMPSGSAERLDLREGFNVRLIALIRGRR